MEETTVHSFPFLILAGYEHATVSSISFEPGPSIHSPYHSLDEVSEQMLSCCCCCCWVTSVMSDSCDPIHGSPPGCPVPGILQARALEWVAISFSNEWKWKVKVKSLSHVRPSVTPWTAAFQAPQSMGFSRQEYWNGVPLPSPAIMLISSLKWFTDSPPSSRLSPNSLTQFRNSLPFDICQHHQPQPLLLHSSQTEQLWVLKPSQVDLLPTLFMPPGYAFSNPMSMRVC